MSGDKLTTFDPRKVPWQWEALKKIENFDYSLGVHEVLFSGTVGSAKTLFMTHTLMRHIIKHPKARGMIGRLSMPDLKETLLQSVIDHMEGSLEEGQDYEYNRQKVKFEFRNGATLLGLSWAKKNWKRFGSFGFSIAAIEEVNENHGDYWQAYEAIYQRLGRAKGVHENLMMGACNPDTPAHPLYKRMMESDSPLRHVFYSDTRDNPFVPRWYIDNLMENLSPIEVERKVKGRWVEDPKGSVYYNYDSTRNYRDEEYVFDLHFPIAIMHDFNIGEGKPMSAAVGQIKGNTFHVAKTFLVDGADTNEIMEEMAADGVFERLASFHIFGDATGKRKDTRSKKSDYDIIKRFLDLYRRKDHSAINYTMRVPRANPPIRTRHNKVNAKFLNPFGDVNLYIYKGARDADIGFRLTKLKKGADYIEDDTLREQHVTTAIGYWICQTMKQNSNARIRMTTR